MSAVTAFRIPSPCAFGAPDTWIAGEALRRRHLVHHRRTTRKHSAVSVSAVTGAGGQQPLTGGADDEGMWLLADVGGEGESAVVRGSTPGGVPDGPEELPAVDVWGEGDAGTGTSPLQTAGSIIFTGGLTLLLVRTFRRRAKNAKEAKLRSTVVERLSPGKAELEKSKADLAAASSAEPETPPPSALGALSGAVMAGLITYVTYLFTINVDDILGQQAMPTNYTARSITITVRTIISGLGWLATGVFGANTLGLTLLGFQVALGLDENSKKKAALEENPSDEGKGQ